MQPRTSVSASNGGRLRNSVVLQWLVGAFVTLAIPALAIYLFGDFGSGTEELRNSIYASGAAFTFSHLLSNRLADFPGLTRIESDLPIFIGAYMVVAVALLVFRVSYSNAFLLTSFVFACITGLVFATSLSKRVPVYSVVPFGTINRLGSISHANFRYMKTSDLTDDDDHHALVADLRADLPDEWERALAQAALEGRPVYHVKQLEEALTGKVDIEHMSENSLGTLLPNRMFGDAKFLIDRLTTLVVLPILIVPLALVALAIRLDSPGPVLFRQERIGRGGQPFWIYKFRSMAHGEQRDNEREASVTDENDKRVTRVGQFIRRYRIDELPQLLNVLKGEMSWIGPRPEAAALSAWYLSELPFYSYRHIVRPGITGWAQVNQGHVADLSSVHDKLRYDFYYIKNFSLSLDILILLRTVRIVLGGFGVK